MKDRIKAIRKALGLSQTDFGKSLGVSLSAVFKWESGENELSDAVVLLICQRYGVSEIWLKTGEGEMFAPKEREEELAEFVAELCRDDAPEFRKRLVSVLSRLDDNGWSVLEKIVDSLTKNP